MDAGDRAVNGRWSLTAVVVGGSMLSGCASAAEAGGAADELAVVPEESVAGDVDAELSMVSPTVCVGRFSASFASMNGLPIAETNKLTHSSSIDQSIALYDSL